MGLVHAEIKLTNSGDLEVFKRGYIKEDEVRHETVTALVNSGAYMLTINENIKGQLELRVVDSAQAELADGSIKQVDIVGPVEIRFKNRRCSVDAAVMPGNAEVLLGAIPMEDMDVVILPKEQKLVVNPENPYIAKKSFK